MVSGYLDKAYAVSHTPSSKLCCWFAPLLTFPWAHNRVINVCVTWGCHGHWPVCQCSIEKLMPLLSWHLRHKSQTFTATWIIENVLLIYLFFAVSEWCVKIEFIVSICDFSKSEGQTDGHPRTRYLLLPLFISEFKWQSFHFHFHFSVVFWCLNPPLAVPQGSPRGPESAEEPSSWDSRGTQSNVKLLFVYFTFLASNSVGNHTQERHKGNTVQLPRGTIAQLCSVDISHSTRACKERGFGSDVSSFLSPSSHLSPIQDCPVQ